METKKLTAAENTLATMAKTVLILGIIGSIIVFFASCAIWQYSKYSGSIVGMDGVNWLGLPYVIFCIMGTLISWAVLSILVEISVNIRSDKAKSNWKKDFAVMIATEQKDKAKEILFRKIMDSEEFKLGLSETNATSLQRYLDQLNEKYSKYLKAIGEDTFINIEKFEMLKAL